MLSGDLGEERKTLHQLAKLVAIDLGWKYSKSHNEDIAVLTKGELGLMMVTDSRQRTHVRVTSYLWPSYESFNRGDTRINRMCPRDLWDPKETDPEVRIAIVRGHASIAKDIEKRFLPDYLRIFIRCKAICEQRQTANDIERTSWRVVCAALGVTPDHTLHYLSDQYSTQVHQSGNGARLILDCTPEQCIEVLAAIKSVKREEE